MKPAADFAAVSARVAHPTHCRRTRRLSDEKSCSSSAARSLSGVTGFRPNHRT